MARTRAMIILAGALMLALPTVPAASAEEEKACPAPARALPAEYIGWSNGVASTALTKYHPRAKLLTERKTMLKLHRSPLVAYVVKPERAVEAGTYGGLMAVQVTKPGQLRIALDGRGWVDLVKDRRALVPSVAHGHGPECSGIRKIVAFDVTPGRYIVQIANAPEARISAMALMPR